MQLVYGMNLQISFDKNIHESVYYLVFLIALCELILKKLHNYPTYTKHTFYKVVSLSGK